MKIKTTMQHHLTCTEMATSKKTNVIKDVEKLEPTASGNIKMVQPFGFSIKSYPTYAFICQKTSTFHKRKSIFSW